MHRELVATLSPATYANPALLYDALPDAGGAAAVTVTGNTLTIDPVAGFVGTLSVLVTVTDIGGLSDSALIRVDVTPAATAAAAAGSQLAFYLDGEGEGGGLVRVPQADAPSAGGESGFSDPFTSLGAVAVTDSGATSGSAGDAVSAALDELFGEEFLLDDDVADSLAADQLRSE